MCLACLQRLGKNIATPLVDVGCALAAFAVMRQAILPLAAGVVVEVGFGSGHCLPFYEASRVSRVIGIEPDAGMRRRAESNLRLSRVPAEMIDARAEALPLRAACADTVVLSYVLCTVRDPGACLAEAARILGPGGRLLFCEHGQAAGATLQCLQRRIDGVWGRIAGGCTLLRDPLSTLRDGGFRCGAVRQAPFPGVLAVLGQHVGGWAVPSTQMSRAERRS